jgi:hypothetical protein
MANRRVQILDPQGLLMTLTGDPFPFEEPWLWLSIAGIKS